MTPQEKANELMARMNGQIITKEIWDKASDYAKQDLKRKALIVVDEIFELIKGQDFLALERYWNEVKTEINNL